MECAGSVAVIAVVARLRLRQTAAPADCSSSVCGIRSITAKERAQNVVLLAKSCPPCSYFQGTCSSPIQPNDAVTEVDLPRSGCGTVAFHELVQSTAHPDDACDSQCLEVL